MYIKNDKAMFNTEKFDMILISGNVLRISRAEWSDHIEFRGCLLGRYSDAEAAAEVLNEIFEAMKNGEETYTMPAGKEEM